MRKVLTIAGSDCSGGAGIQADLKTITAHKLYGMSVITALTAQNTTGVKSIMEAEPEFVADQLDAVFTDIYPDSVKIGMVSNSRIIRVIADKLLEYGAKNIVKRVANPNTHGTGCTLSSAIACNLALGFSVENSVANAKAYLTGALEAMLDLGAGSGPLNHVYAL